MDSKISCSSSLDGNVDWGYIEPLRISTEADERLSEPDGLSGFETLYPIGYDSTCQYCTYLANTYGPEDEELKEHIENGHCYASDSDDGISPDSETQYRYLALVQSASPIDFYFPAN